MTTNPLEKLTVEEVRKIKTIREFKHYATQEADEIGLLGNQPTLKRIREAYKSGDCTEQELDILLEALYANHQGQEEPFESAKAFYKFMFPEPYQAPAPKPEMTAQEQTTAIARILGDDLKKTPKSRGARKSPVKPKKQEIKIDKSLLPESLRHLL